MLEPGITLASRYRIGEVIARGGMGIVVRAEDERLGRTVAIKTVRTDDPELIHRLRREAQHLARLSHPNIVRLFDVVEHDGQPCLVTQLVEGQPLRALLGHVDSERTAWIGEQIASACAAAHAVGIVHRDLKPSNVLVDDDALHLLDFGIARNVDDTTLTNVNTIVGTASYISPEQLRGLPAQPAADVYALGLVLVECLTGRAAYPGTFAETVATRLVSPPRLDGVPPAWRRLLERMTAVNPADRPDAPAVADDLRRLRRTLAAGANPAPLFAAPVAAVDRLAPSPAPVGVGAVAPIHPGPRRRRRPLPARLAVPAAVAAGFLTVAGLGAALTGAPEPLASTEVAAAVPVTAAPSIPPTTLPTTTTTWAPPPTTAPPTTTPPTTAPPATAPKPVTPTTLDAATTRELQRMAEAQRKKETADLKALQEDFEERLKQFVKDQTKGRRRG